MSTKFTNPKDGIGITKLPAHLVSPIVKAYQAIAHYLGNVKYGAWNYRAAGARASVYKAALERHMDAWWEGEECDPVDGTPHLANALACIGILIDAKHAGLLTDDRPPSQASELRAVRDEFEGLMVKLQAMYGDREVRHYTIADTAEIAAQRVVSTTKEAWVGVDPGKPGSDVTAASIMMFRWGGGQCPVDRSTKVLFTVRDFPGVASHGRAGDLRWSHTGDGGDIVAYRVYQDGDDGGASIKRDTLGDAVPIAPSSGLYFDRQQVAMTSWAGGECPVDKDAYVRYVLRGHPAARHGGMAGDLTWQHTGSSSDIIAYRVVSEG